LRTTVRAEAATAAVNTAITRGTDKSIHLADQFPPAPGQRGQEVNAQAQTKAPHGFPAILPQRQQRSRQSDLTGL
jgi:hypothetical protein